MTTLVLYLTEDGQAELINNELMELGPVELSEVCFGSGSWVPDPDENGIVAISELDTEIKSLDAIAGNVLDSNRLHITAKDISDDEYDVSEIGIRTSTGTLFAVGSWADPVISKAAAMLLVSFDLVVSGNALESITIEDISFSNPEATETIKGIVELATSAEVIAGSDGVRAVTPAGLAALTASTSRRGLVELLTNDEALAGTDTERALTAAALLHVLQNITLSKRQTIAQQTITATDLYEFDHALGARPRFIQMFLVCLDAEHGYGVGDIVPIPCHVAGEASSAAKGHAVKVTSSKIYLSIDTNHGMLLHEWNNTSNFEAARNKWAAFFEVAL